MKQIPQHLMSFPGYVNHLAALKKYLLIDTGYDLQGAEPIFLRVKGKDLRDSNLQYANLQYAYFIDSDFRGANLQNINMKNAVLTGSDFSNANLTGTNLDQAATAGCSGLPVGMDSFMFVLCCCFALGVLLSIFSTAGEQGPQAPSPQAAEASPVVQPLIIPIILPKSAL